MDTIPSRAEHLGEHEQPDDSLTEDGESGGSGGIPLPITSSDSDHFEVGSDSDNDLDYTTPKYPADHRASSPVSSPSASHVIVNEGTKSPCPKKQDDTEQTRDINAESRQTNVQTKRQTVVLVQTSEEKKENKEDDTVDGGVGGLGESGDGGDDEPFDGERGETKSNNNNCFTNQLQGDIQSLEAESSSVIQDSFDGEMITEEDHQKHHHHSGFHNVE